MNRLMIDIETYATSNSVDGRPPQIVQIGAAYTVGDGIMLDDTFLASVADTDDPRFCQDPDTLDWWDKQSVDAQESLTLNLEADIWAVLDKFQFWLGARGFTKNQKQWTVWANPPAFDLVHINSACKVVGREPIWHYRQERCVRTIYNEFRPTRILDVPEGLVAHRADHDAIRQMVGLLERI
jgi:hypothetical protein